MRAGSLTSVDQDNILELEAQVGGVRLPAVDPVKPETLGLAAVGVVVGECVVGGQKREEMVRHLPGAIATSC